MRSSACLTQSDLWAGVMQLICRCWQCFMEAQAAKCQAGGDVPAYHCCVTLLPQDMLIVHAA